MSTKRTVTARLYTVDYQDSRHQLTAESSSDLAKQVQAITSSRQAAMLARAAWGDDAADLKAGGVRIVCVGAIVREVWRSLPALKGQETTEPQQRQEATAPTPPQADTQPQGQGQPAAEPQRAYLNARPQPAASSNQGQEGSHSES